MSDKDERLSKNKELIHILAPILFEEESGSRQPYLLCREDVQKRFEMKAYNVLLSLERYLVPKAALSASTPKVPTHKISGDLGGWLNCEICKKQICMDGDPMADELANEACPGASTPNTRVRDLVEALEGIRNDIFYYMTRHAHYDKDGAYDMLGKIKEDAIKALAALPAGWKGE